MNENFNHVIDKDMTRSLISKDIRSNFIEMHRAEKNVILSLTQKEMQDFHLDFLQAQKELEQNIAALRIRISDENIGTLEAIQTLFFQYVNVNEDIYHLSRVNSNQQATDLSTTKSKEYIARASDLISELITYNTTQMIQAKALSDERYNDTFNRLLIISSVVTIIIFYFVFLVYNYLNERLLTIYKRISIIKAGVFNDESERERERESDSENDELGLIGLSLFQAIKLLKENTIAAQDENWIKEGLNGLSNQLITQNNPLEVSRIAVNYLCSYLKAGIGSVYVFDENEGVLNQYANYAFVQREEISNRFKLGDYITTECFH